MTVSSRNLRIAVIIIAFITSVLSNELSARRLSPSEAKVRISQRSRAVEYDPELVYQDSDDLYYVFQTGERGYVVASGDDCVATVLAMVTDGVFDVDSLPDAMLWLLDCYKQEIIQKSDNSVQSIQSDEITALYSRWTEINPLMSCSWSQGSPFSDLCPIVSGSRSMTGCVATAMAQIICTIGYAKGSGSRTLYYDSKPVTYDYEADPIDFDNLLDQYNYGASEESLTAVAKLMLACGIGVKMNYSGSESAAYSEDVAPAMIQYFGYDKTLTRGFERVRYSTSFWESLIYGELTEGRPVYYSGQSRVSAHAFVIDGYRPEGLWHINWGWGGRSDGYFRLPDLNPSRFTDDSDLSTAGGYNGAQYLVKSVPPGANPGVVVPDMSGSISKIGDDTYSVFFQSNGTFLLNLTLGALIVNEDDSEVKSWQPFWSGQNVNSTGSLYHDSYHYDFSQADLAPGKYRIYPAIILDGTEDPVICDAASGRNHYMSLTVDVNGRYHIENANPVAEIFTHNLYVAEEGENILYGGWPGSLSVYLVNEGSGDFYGTIYFNLLDADTRAKVLTQYVSSAVVPGGSNARITAAFRVIDSDGNELPAAKYILTLTDYSGVSLINNTEDIYVTVDPTYPPIAEYSNTDLYITNASTIPQYYIQGDMWEHSPDMRCFESFSNVTLDVAFYPPGVYSGAKRYQFYRGDLSYVSGTFRKPDFVIDLPFGIYDVCYCADYSPISVRRRVYVGQQIGDLYYLPVDDSSVAVCHHPQRAYSGFVSVPAAVSIEGKSYTVVRVNDEAFLGCRSLEGVRLPYTITSIGRNALLYCTGLKNLIFDGEQTPFAFHNYVMGGTDASSVYAPATSYDQYHDLLSAHHDVYASIEQISSGRIEISSATDVAELIVTPAHEALNGEFFVVADTDEASPAAEISGVELVGDRLMVALTANHPGSIRYVITSAQPTVEPAVLSVNVTDLAAIDLIEAEAEPNSDLIFDLQGRATKERRGFRIIIHNGKARLIKL